MDNILDEVCSSDDLKFFENKYNDEKLDGSVSSTTQFEYACFLVKSRYPADIQRGILLLEELYRKKSETGKRDYVFYLAIGNARQKEYRVALNYLQGMLKVEPSNRQVLDLETTIRKRMESDALKGAAITGGALLLGVGALAGIGMALASRK